MKRDIPESRSINAEQGHRECLVIKGTTQHYPPGWSLDKGASEKELTAVLFMAEGQRLFVGQRSVSLPG